MSYWETILQAAFATIGAIEHLKGYFKAAPAPVWRGLQPLLCVAFAALFQYVAADWVRVGVMALALSQVGYDAIIKAVRSKIGAPNGTT